MTAKPWLEGISSLRATMAAQLMRRDTLKLLEIGMKTNPYGIRFCQRTLALMVAFCISTSSWAQTVPPPVPTPEAAPALITSDELAAAERSPAQADLLRMLSRDEVVAALQARGVSAQAARERVAALTDEEAARVAAQIDRLPAGGDGIGAIVFIFVLLLITDILGFTKVFPFTRSIR
jgi:hypothetical protein